MSAAEPVNQQLNRMGNRWQESGNRKGGHPRGLGGAKRLSERAIETGSKLPVREFGRHGAHCGFPARRQVNR